MPFTELHRSRRPAAASRIRRSLRHWLPPAALLLAPLVAAPVLDAATETGTIVGRVRLVSVHSTAPIALSYSSRHVTAPGPPVRDIRNVVVYVDRQRTAPVKTSTHEMRQQDEVFRPHVLPLTVGSTVVFPNADPFFHNVFSLSGAAAFDLGRYPPGDARKRVFDHPGLIKVFCHLHAHMSAVIMVFSHPWFAIPADDGQFEIAGVPTGAVELTAWHERIGEARATVDVAPGGVSSVEFALPVLDR
jgi:plastocyanin